MSNIKYVICSYYWDLELQMNVRESFLQDIKVCIFVRKATWTQTRLMSEM